MNRGIIFVDIPERCGNCRMCFYNEYYDQFECYFKPGEEIGPYDDKQDWCPIEEVSEQEESIKHLSREQVTKV